MADGKKLYDLKVGTRLFRNITVAVIVKNIRNGKLSPENELSVAGINQWVELGNVPELRRFFGAEPVSEAAVNTSLFDIKHATNNEVESGISRTNLVEMIRVGNLNEGDQIRQQGGAIWTLAGDMQSLQRYFEQRRAILRERGSKGLPRDTGAPFYRDLKTPLSFFTTGAFIFNLVAVIIMFSIAALVQVPVIAGPINVLTSFYLYAYFFRTLSHTANGKTSFPDMVDFSDFMAELVRPGVQFFLSRVYALMPLLAYLSLWVMRGWDFFEQQPFLMTVLALPWIVLIMPFPRPIDPSQMFDSFLMQFENADEMMEGGEAALEALIDNYFQYLTFDFIVWVALIVFVLFFAISLMRQAAYGQFLPPINLPAIVLSISRAPGAFMALVGILIALDVLLLLATFLSMFIFGMAYGMSAALYHVDPTNPIVAQLSMVGFTMIVTAIDIAIGFFKMYFLGRFVWQYSEQMGWD